MRSFKLFFFLLSYHVLFDQKHKDVFLLTILANQSKPLNLSSITTCRIPRNTTWENNAEILIENSTNNGTNTWSLSNPLDMFIDKSNQIYIVNTGKNRILRYNSQNKNLETVAEISLHLPQSVFVDSNTGDMYIVDIFLRDVDKKKEKYFRVQYWQKDAAIGKIIINGTDSLDDDIVRIFLDVDLNIYISYRFKIKKWFASDYTYNIAVAEWTDTPRSPSGMYVDENFDIYLFKDDAIEKWAYLPIKFTKLIDNLPKARCMTMDCNKNIYFAGNDRQGIYQFNIQTKQLKFLTARNNLFHSSAIQFDSDGNIYALELQYNQLKKFSIIH